MRSPALTQLVDAASVDGTPDQLQCVSVPVAGGPIDLVAVAGPDGVFWQHDGHGLAGRGTALRLTLPTGLAAAPDQAASGQAVLRSLQRIRTHDTLQRAGSGPVAIGALPFDPAAPASLVIPALLVGRDSSGAQWLTVITPDDVDVELDPTAARALVDDIVESGLRHSAGWSPDRFVLESPLSHEEWSSLVVEATTAVAAGAFEKVVLAREVTVEANRPFVTSEVLRRLLVLHPSCMVFSVDGFIGASPELLIDRTGTGVTSHPLAGTISRSGDIAADEALATALLASAKDRHEHGVVVAAVATALGRYCQDLNVPAAPSIVALRNVSHLGTKLEGTLRGDQADGSASALDLVGALHPTPAVGGSPTEAALRFLNIHEGLARGRYAGPVGWMDARGDGRWAIAIRSAEVADNRARLYAGVGVVAGSDPEEELAETQLKLQAMLAALVRP